MFARVENGVTKFSPKKQKTPKIWIRNSAVFNIYSAWGIFIFWPRKNQLLGGG